MTNAQLHLAIGMPTLAVLVGILVNVMQFSALNGRISSVETSLNARMSGIEARMNALETRIQNLETKLDTRFDLLMSKVFEIDNRLTRLEHN
jgi:flagellar capping protein FliD